MDVGSSATSSSRMKNLEEYKDVDEISYDAEILTRDNFILSQLVEVFERYLRKRSPALLSGMERFLESQLSVRGSVRTDRSVSVSSAKSLQSPVNTLVRTSTTSSTLRGLASRSNAKSSLGGFKISAAVKADLVEKELEDNRMTMEKLQRKFESAKFLLQTEEENLRVDIEFLDEGKRALEGFVVQSTETKSGQVYHDKFLRFLEQELQDGDRYLRKTKLNSKSLYTNYRRVLARQHQRMELREWLHPIDIEKLLIENQEQLDVLDGKSKKLEELKRTAGRKGQTLVSVKSRMNDTVLSLVNLKYDINQKGTKSKYIKEQENQNQSLLRAAERINKDFNNLNKSYKTQDVESYLLLQTKLEETKIEHLAWERRCKYQNQQISLLEHQVKQLKSVRRFSNYSSFKKLTPVRPSDGSRILLSILPS
ncbi:uncharacterized protein LOC128993869 [Macrosteles quadrilineatus]|uniref:uncharacterized protein LOC128993869 n=1 Tax=Macrosteles quadrilineatus TaxID=74068 RepID=UPI0023E2FC5D|nr:uncharacterized protein LOC128993869 [Macrosteles quadrilineatus]